jgi:hypothetical protein
MRLTSAVSICNDCSLASDRLNSMIMADFSAHPYDS